MWTAGSVWTAASVLPRSGLRLRMFPESSIDVIPKESELHVQLRERPRARFLSHRHLESCRCHSHTPPGGDAIIRGAAKKKPREGSPPRRPSVSSSSEEAVVLSVLMDAPPLSRQYFCCLYCTHSGDGVEDGGGVGGGWRGGCLESSDSELTGTPL